MFEKSAPAPGGGMTARAQSASSVQTAVRTNARYHILLLN